MAIILLVVLIALFVRLVCRKQTGSGCDDQTETSHCCYKFQNYRTKPIASDIPGMAPLLNEEIVNPWGIVKNPDSNEVWIAQNVAGVLTLLNTDGTSVSTVTVPSAHTATGSPSGVSVVPSSLQEQNAFLMGETGSTGTSQVLTVTEDGLICGYNATIDATHAVVIKDNSGSNTVYKGCAITSAGRFYACNFFDGRIEVYDTKWNLETTISDSIMMSLGYSPFNIVCCNNALYVSFALQDGSDQSKDVPGIGNGFILVYDLNGNLLRRLVTRGVLNSPWGMVIYKTHLFVANSGDGLIQVFNRCNGRFVGTLLSRCRVPVVIEGLKGILLDCQPKSVFCKKKCQTCSNGFLFTAGINNETSGLFGRIKRIC